MNPEDAYKVLGVSESISDDELKVKYKELAKKYHPDIYKEDPDKFKKINEAYQLIVDYRSHPEKYRPQQQQPGFWSQVVDLGDIFFNGGEFFRSNAQDESPLRATPINIAIDLTFQESVTGCSKEVSYTRNIKCKPCNGAGFKIIGNGCDKCDGFGRVTTRQGNMVFQDHCKKCNGKGTKKPKCETCDGKRVVEDKRSGSVNIPAGSVDGNILRLAGEGHFAGRSFFNDSYTDVNIRLKIKTYKDMFIENNDVHSTCNISLLEALEGVSKDIETVYGNKNITIPAKTRHSDQIKIPKCGVKGTTGAHVITLNVEYPNDISNIIGVLKDGVPNTV